MVTVFTAQDDRPPQIEIRRNDLFFVSEKPTYETNTLLGFLSTNHPIFGASAN